MKNHIRAQDRRIFIERIRIVCMYMAAPLVLSFSAVDYFYAPEKMKEFFLLRLWIIPTSILCLFLSKRTKVIKRNFDIPTAIIILFLGVYHAVLVSKTGFEVSAYYAGINLALIVSISFFPWQIKRLWVPILLNVAPYMITVLFFSSSNQMQYLVPHSAFIISTTFLGVLAYLVTRNLRISEIKAKIELEKVNRDQAEVIKQKTRDGIYLEKLATQFSPQVVDAVKRGSLSLDSRERREITCIFLDIQNSTARSIKIDHSAFVSVLEEFFEGVFSIFLKYDITIGTFLGDGLLCFANAPQTSTNHTDNALRACLELIELHSKRRKYYLERWRSEFNIRIGIELGFATVGFFPSTKKGTYTAVGDVVSRASRYCTRAELNTICVSKKLLLDIKDFKNFEAKRMAVVTDLKGFEGESFELYTLSNSHPATDDVLLCPLCQNQMIQDGQVGQAYYIKCISCNYRDLIDVEDLDPFIKNALGNKKVS